MKSLLYIRQIYNKKNEIHSQNDEYHLKLNLKTVIFFVYLWQFLVTANEEFTGILVEELIAT